MVCNFYSWFVFRITFLPDGDDVRWATDISLAEILPGPVAQSSLRSRMVLLVKRMLTSFIPHLKKTCAEAFLPYIDQAYMEESRQKGEVVNHTHKVSIYTLKIIAPE